jgi:glycosyltransferase involved in cell wall biosynthesis
MKIALNMMAQRLHGAKFVGLGILRGFRTCGDEHTYTAWLPDAWSAEDLVDLPTRLTARRCAPGMQSKFRTENFVIRRALGEEAFDRLFSTGDTSTIRPGIPHMLLVQQAYLAYPQSAFDFPMPLKFRLKLWAMGAYFRSGMPAVSLFTVQSNSMAQQLHRRWGIAPARIKVVPSSINLPTLPERPAPPGPPYLCYVAGANPHKNHDLLAPMLARLVQDWPDLRCHVTVTPEQAPTLAAAVQTYKLEDNLIFCGNLSYPATLDLIRHAYVSVIPSKLESFGLPYYESLALGCPIVAADRDFAREACGEAGSYADPNDGVAFAEQVHSLLAAPELRMEMSERALKRFRQVYRPWSSIAQQYLDMLAALP